MSPLEKLIDEQLNSARASLDAAEREFERRSSWRRALELFAALLLGLAAGILFWPEVQRREVARIQNAARERLAEADRIRDFERTVRAWTEAEREVVRREGIENSNARLVLDRLIAEAAVPCKESLLRAASAADRAEVPVQPVQPKTLRKPAKNPPTRRRSPTARRSRPVGLALGGGR